MWGSGGRDIMESGNGTLAAQAKSSSFLRIPRKRSPTIPARRTLAAQPRTIGQTAPRALRRSTASTHVRPHGAATEFPVREAPPARPLREAELAPASKGRATRRHEYRWH